MKPHKIEPIKRLLEKATGVGLRRARKLSPASVNQALRMKFRDDGYIPNNPRFPLLYYGQALRFSRKHDPAAIL